MTGDYDDSNEISTLDGDLWIGDFLVRPLLKKVVRLDADGEHVEAHSLPDKAMGVLVYLAEHSRQVCERDDILDAVWGEDREAYDRVLDTAIGEIRRVFGDDARRSSYVQTVPKVGYRLLTPRSEIRTPNQVNGPSRQRAGKAAPPPISDDDSRSAKARSDSRPILMGTLAIIVVSLLSAVAMGSLARRDRADGSAVYVHLEATGSAESGSLISRQDIENELFEAHPCEEKNLLRRDDWLSERNLEVELSGSRDGARSIASAKVRWTQSKAVRFARIVSRQTRWTEPQGLLAEDAQRFSKDVRVAADRMLCEAEGPPQKQRACHCLASAEGPVSSFNRPTEIVRSLETAIELDPGLLPAYSSLSAVYFRMADQKKALSTLRDGLAQVEDLDSADGLNLRRNLAIANRDLETAKDITERLVSLQPENWQNKVELAAMLADNFKACDESIQIFDELDAKYPGEASIEIGKAEALGRCRHGDEAIDLLLNSAQTRPTDSRILKSLVPTLVHAGRLRDAETFAQRLLALRPDDPGSYWYLGGVAIEMGHYRDAKRWLKASRELDPWPADLGYILWYEAVIAEHMFDFATCAELSRRATSLLPRHRLRLGEGEAMCLAKDGQIEAAAHLIEELEGILVDHGTYSESWRLLTIEAMLAGSKLPSSSTRYLEIEEMFEQALEQSFGDSDLEPNGFVAFNAGETLESFDSAAAEGFFRKAAKSSRVRKWAVCKLGLLLRRGGQTDEALPYLREVIDAFGNPPEDPLGMECAEALAELDPTFTVAN